MIFHTFTSFSFATLLMCTSHLIADESTQKEATEETADAMFQERVSVRSREMDSFDRERMRRSNPNQPQNDAFFNYLEAERRVYRANHRASEGEFMFAPRHMTHPQVALANYGFAVTSHWLARGADDYSYVELEDGSQWDVHPSDRAVLRSWRREAPLVITPSYNFLSSYDYFITNKDPRNQSKVRANILAGPKAFGPRSHWIIDIDYYSGHVRLENQSIWCVNPENAYILKDWSTNDHVIFGLSDLWFSPFSQLLINVNMGSHISVKQY